jgi:hypothetical protein
MSRSPLPRLLAIAGLLAPLAARADDAPAPFVPQLLGAQYTFVDQH